jgi:hypothetical protein
MLTIRQAQWRALARVPRDTFLQQEAAAARSRHPQRYAPLAHAALLHLVERLVDLADEHDLVFRQDVQAFVRCVLRHGPQVDHLLADAVVAQTLADPTLCGADKVRRLEAHAPALAEG